jgi:hypothetical protein
LTAVMGLPTLDALGADGFGPHTFEEHIFLDQVDLDRHGRQEPPSDCLSRG